MYFLFLFILVHPCDREDKEFCSDICNKKGEDYECACEPNKYKLAADGKTCEKGK